MDNLLSVIIASRNERYLQATIDDLLKNARGPIEIVVILDENDQEVTPDPRVRVYKKVGKPGMRSALNQGISLAKGKYIMKTDAHCMFSEGFDEVLKANCADNWIVIPRRYSLDPEKWAIKTERPIVDYEYFVFPFQAELNSVKTGGKWHSRRDNRKEMWLDDEMEFQGSCWFTTKQHLLNIGGFDINTSTGDEFVLESEELSNKTWLSGGKVMVNKHAFYAHWHKGSAGRGYFINKWPMRKQRIFHIDYWMNDRWPKAIHTMEWFIERFWPLPGWPDDWRDPKYQEEYKRKLGLGQYPTE